MTGEAAVPALHSRQQQEYSPQQGALGGSSRIWLIAVGLCFAWVSQFSYAELVQPMFEYTGMVYDPGIAGRMPLLMLAAVVIPLGLLSPRLLPGHLFALVVFAFVYVSIFTVAPHALGEDVFLPIAPILIVSMALIVCAANMQLPFRPSGNEVAFTRLLWLVLGLVALPLIAAAVQNGVQLPSFSEIYDLRSELNIGGPAGYAIQGYTFAIGPVTIAYALTQKRRWLALTGVGIYVLCYALTFQKTLVIAPILVVMVWVLLGRVDRARTWMALGFYACPLLAALALALASPDWAPNATGYVLDRMYAIPGQIFANYVDFFSRNPHTWFSHVHGFDWFVAYPYDKPLPVLIGENYPGGNQNASFWTQDAVAGAGMWAIPILSIVFGAVLVLVNTAARGLDPRFALTAVSMSAQRFSDGSLPTALFSGGLTLLIVMLLLAPRDDATEAGK